MSLSANLFAAFLSDDDGSDAPAKKTKADIKKEARRLKTKAFEENKSKADKQVKGKRKRSATRATKRKKRKQELHKDVDANDVRVDPDAKTNAADSATVGTVSSAPEAASSDEAAAKLEVDFEPGKLGLTLSSDGLVTRVADGEQADCNGVRVAMTVVSIQGEPFTEERLKAAFAGKDKCRVVFAKACRERETASAERNDKLAKDVQGRPDSRCQDDLRLVNPDPVEYTLPSCEPPLERRQVQLAMDSPG